MAAPHVTGVAALAGPSPPTPPPRRSGLDLRGIDQVAVPDRQGGHRRGAQRDRYVGATRDARCRKRPAGGKHRGDAYDRFQRSVQLPVRPELGVGFGLHGQRRRCRQRDVFQADTGCSTSNLPRDDRGAAGDGDCRRHGPKRQRHAIGCEFGQQTFYYETTPLAIVSTTPSYAESVTKALIRSCFPSTSRSWRRASRRAIWLSAPLG